MNGFCHIRREQVSPDIYVIKTKQTKLQWDVTGQFPEVSAGTIKGGVNKLYRGVQIGGKI